MTKVRCLVGIPTLNGPDRLERCLKSIRECTDFARFDVQILVSDDGSTPEMLEKNKHAVHRYDVPMLFGHGRTGIAATWNRMVRHDVSKREVVVLVNDDIEVVDDWLDVLAFSVLENPQAGMVGLNTYCGAFKMPPTTPRLDYIEAHLLAGGGALVASHGPIFAFRREVWDEVGGFDERYFVFYEEVDFGVSLGERGYRHYMASYPICFHMGGATNSNPANLNAQARINESRGKFTAKWGKSLDQLRREVLAQRVAADKNPAASRVREWNTQLKVWRDE